MSRIGIESSVKAFKDVEKCQILKLIGNTQLLKVDLFKNEFPEVEVYGKAEWFNPGGSVKDRPAFNMVKEGINSGDLCSGKVLMVGGGCGEGGEIGGGGAGDDEDDEYERLADDLSRLGERIGDGFRRECGEEDGE